jgi:hypothetical protein
LLAAADAAKAAFRGADGPIAYVSTDGSLINLTGNTISDIEPDW